MIQFILFMIIMYHTYNFMKLMTVYVIQHSHTDIGYTESQEKIMRYHADYIRQAINYLDMIDNGKLENCSGFKWQCENYWQVENFYRRASEEEKLKFENYVKKGSIGISANYLNETDLVDGNILVNAIRRAKGYANGIGVGLKSAMTADVNGYSWGFADILADNGIENLFSAIHTHHGMFPLYRKQTPFYWKGTGSKKVLTWIGEHYHFGNEMFISPGAYNGHQIVDRVTDDIDSGRLFDSFDEVENMRQELDTAEERLNCYFDRLDSEGYPYDFLPITVSGAITDNSPPNPYVAERIAELNKRFDGKAFFKMATLEEFFSAVRNSKAPIPEYSGDFTDWWADGVCSTPDSVKLYRDAVRKYHVCEKLDGDSSLGNKDKVKAAEENMLLFAEHTWGHFDSVARPWYSTVNELRLKKSAYAANAHMQITENMSVILEKLGDKNPTFKSLPRFKIINPHSVRCCTTVKLHIDSWNFVGGSRINGRMIIRARDESTGKLLACQPDLFESNYTFEVAVDLVPHAEITVVLERTIPKVDTTGSFLMLGADRVRDVDSKETPNLIETKFFKIDFSLEKGVKSILDKRFNREIVNSERVGAFTCLYEKTESASCSNIELRKKMGRSRSSAATVRSAAKVKNIEVVETGDVYVNVKISYSLEETKLCEVYLKVYKTVPIIEARVVLEKQCVWSPENVYVALPFTAGGDNETYIDKTGCIIRPGIDQLPGSCESFYLLQDGIVRKGEGDLIIASKDAPLVSFGDRIFRPVSLCDGKNIELNRSDIYSWIMNNFWETNFNVNLGGFYEFIYTVTSCEKQSADDDMKLCAALNEGLTVLKL